MLRALPFLLLVGCADIQDNTTLGDKVIIGLTVITMAYGASVVTEGSQ